MANMSVMWGGKQSKVRAMEIKEEAGFLRSHSCKLKVGDMQHMQFQEEDEGPYSMDPIQWQLLKYDEIKGMKSKNRLKKDLSEELKALGYNVRGKSLKEIKEIAKLQNTPMLVVEHGI